MHNATSRGSVLGCIVMVAIANYSTRISYKWRRSKGLAIIFAVVATLLLARAMLLLILAAAGINSEFYNTVPVAFPFTCTGLSDASSPKGELPAISKATHFLELLRHNGSSPCHHARTQTAVALALSENRSISRLLRLHTGHPFSFRLVSVTQNSTRRCAGGDFYETQLVGSHWMSRPPVEDMGDGSYCVTIFVDEGFPGMYEFKAVLLFDNMHGLDFDPRQWGIQKEVLNLQVEMVGSASEPKMLQTSYDNMAYLSEKQPLMQIREMEQMEESSTKAAPEIQEKSICRDADGSRDGGGRWTRAWYNRTCEADQGGRYRWCMHENHTDKVSLLESNGWLYSKRTCSFMIWDIEQAWQCLQGRWLLFWGDSNLQDSISNLLFFTLGFLKRPRTDRISHKLYTNPFNSSQSLLISLLFNGHYDESRNGLGLASLYNASYRLRLQQLYRSGRKDGFGPDAIIITSGLHDAEHFHTAHDFSAAVNFAGEFWGQLLTYGGEDVSETSSVQRGHRPIVVLRTAIAPAGRARVKDKQANPHKMEAFNAIMVEGLSRQLGREDIMVHVLDAYDATFPFHFDHNYSDGVHYGREPKSRLSPWFGRPHYYFVDIMLNQMLLNCLCSNFSPRLNGLLSQGNSSESHP